MIAAVDPASSFLPDNVAALKRFMLMREAEIDRAKSRKASAEAMILHLRFAVDRMWHEFYVQRSERDARLLHQMEPGLEELEASVAEDNLATYTNRR